MKISFPSRLLVLATAIVLCALFWASGALAATDTVTSLDDSGEGTLRDAIEAAAPGDTIEFQAELEGQIGLTTGPIVVEKSLTIKGLGSSVLTVNAGGNSKIFIVEGGDFAISDLTLEGGASDETGGAIDQESPGSLTVTGDVFRNDAAGGPGGTEPNEPEPLVNVGYGGAIYVSARSGTTSISESAFIEDSAGGLGGVPDLSGAGFGSAIWVTNPAPLKISKTEFTSNTAGGASGGSGSRSGAGFGTVGGEGEGTIEVAESDFGENVAGSEFGGSGELSGAGSGVAIWAEEGRSVEVTGSQFLENTAGGDGGSGLRSGGGFGGAIAGEGEGTISVTESQFEGGAVGGTGGSGQESGSGFGGAIWTAAGKSLEVATSRFEGNVGAGGDGGGTGELSGAGEGGAIKAEPGAGPVDIVDSTFELNSVGTVQGRGARSGVGIGGAIASAGGLTVSGSTFSGNLAGRQDRSGAAEGFGGAIALDGEPFGDASSVTDSTFVGNIAGVAEAVSPPGAPGFGGAVEISGVVPLTLASVTIDANEAGTGGGGSSIFGAANVIAEGTIVSGGVGAPNCDEPVELSRYSLEGPASTDTSCGFELASADPLLEPLAENGGPTETQALPATSPAVGAIPAASCPTEVDQRGLGRTSRRNPFCDIGAFEQDPSTVPTITSAAAATFEVGKAGSFTVTTTGHPEPDLIETGALPAGVTFVDDGDGTATLAGTPAAGSAGTYAITIDASNDFSGDPQTSQTFTLTVVQPAAPTAPAQPQSNPAASNPSASNPAPSPPPPPAPSLRLAYSPNHPHAPNPAGGPRYTFRFDDGVAGSTFYCRLDKGAFKRCTSPTVYRNLKRGRHVFEVKSVTPAGLESPVKRVAFQAGKRRSS